MADADGDRRHGRLHEALLRHRMPAAAAAAWRVGRGRAWTEVGLQDVAWVVVSRGRDADGVLERAVERPEESPGGRGEVRIDGILLATVGGWSSGVHGV